MTPTPHLMCGMSTQALVGGDWHYSFPVGRFDGGTGALGTDAEIPASGQIRDLRIETDGATGGTVEYELFAAPGIGSITVTIAAGTSGVNNVDWLQVSPTNSLFFRRRATAGAPAAVDVKWSYIWIPDTDDHQILIGGSGAAGLPIGAGVPSRFPLAGSVDHTIGNVNQRFAIMPCAGTLKHLYTDLSSVTLGQRRDVTLYVNNAPTALTVAMEGAQIQEGSDVAHNVAVAAGDRVHMHETHTAPPVPAAGRLQFGLVFVPDSSGQFVWLHAAADDCLNAASTDYYALPWEQIGYDVAWSTTESDRTIPASVNESLFQVEAIYVHTGGTPGAGARSYTYTLRKNGSDTALTFTLVAANNGNASANVRFSESDLLCTEITTSALQPTARKQRISYCVRCVSYASVRILGGNILGANIL